MKIWNSVYSKILESIPEAPPEVGAILGMSRNEICAFEIDKGYEVEGRAIYIPQIEKLNAIISCWNETGIYFGGIVHNHPKGQNVLSYSDKVYIERIMNSMPGSIDELYFPLIPSGMKMVAFCARRTARGVSIIPDEIILIKEK